MTDLALLFSSPRPNCDRITRYSRFDELGTPFGITVDFDSVTDRSVTLRERDTMHQVRGDITSIVDAIQMMVLAKMTWSEVAANFPAFTAAAE